MFCCQGIKYTFYCIKAKLEQTDFQEQAASFALLPKMENVLTLFQRLLCQLDNYHVSTASGNEAS